MSVTEDEFSKRIYWRLQLGRRQSSMEERMDREGRLLIGFCSFSFVRLSDGTPYSIGYTALLRSYICTALYGCIAVKLYWLARRR